MITTLRLGRDVSDLVYHAVASRGHSGRCPLASTRQLQFVVRRMTCGLSDDLWLVVVVLVVSVKWRLSPPPSAIWEQVLGIGTRIVRQGNRGGLMVRTQVRQSKGPWCDSRSGQIAYFHGLKGSQHYRDW